MVRRGTRQVASIVVPPPVPCSRIRPPGSVMRSRIPVKALPSQRSTEMRCHRRSTSCVIAPGRSRPAPRSGMRPNGAALWSWPSAGRETASAPPFRAVRAGGGDMQGDPHLGKAARQIGVVIGQRQVAHGEEPQIGRRCVSIPVRVSAAMSRRPVSMLATASIASNPACTARIKIRIRAISGGRPPSRPPGPAAHTPQPPTREDFSGAMPRAMHEG